MPDLTIPDLRARVAALDKSTPFTIKADAKTALNDFLKYLDQLDQRITTLESEVINGNS